MLGLLPIIEQLRHKPLVRRRRVRPNQLVHIAVGFYTLGEEPPTFGVWYEPDSAFDEITCKRAHLPIDAQTYKVVYSFFNTGNRTVKVIVRWEGGEPPRYAAR